MKKDEIVNDIVDCIDAMMHLSEMMYEEKLHSNTRRYNEYKDQYEEKKNNLKENLKTLIKEN